MKIDELIQQLQNTRAAAGNIDVVFYQEDAFTFEGSLELVSGVTLSEYNNSLAVEIM